MLKLIRPKFPQDSFYHYFCTYWQNIAGLQTVLVDYPVLNYSTERFCLLLLTLNWSTAWNFGQIMKKSLKIKFEEIKLCVCHISGNSQRNTSKSRRRSSLAQLGELLKDWGARDKDKSREKGKFSVKWYNFLLILWSWTLPIARIPNPIMTYSSLKMGFFSKNGYFCHSTGFWRVHDNSEVMGKPFQAAQCKCKVKPYTYTPEFSLANIKKILCRSDLW